MTEIYFYKITCKDETIKDLYIGQTKNYKMREAQHKSHCNNINTKKYNMKLYKKIRENKGWDNWNFQIFCNIKCIDDKESKKIETFFIKLYNANLNVCQRCKKIVTIEKKLNDENIIKSFIESNIIKTNNPKDKILRGDLYSFFHKQYPTISKYLFLKIIGENNKIYAISGYYYYKYIKIKSN